MLVIITIPALNEEKTIGHAIDSLRKVMDKTNYKYKILVYDDGSRDSTSEIAKKNFPSRSVIVPSPVDEFRIET